MPETPRQQLKCKFYSSNQYTNTHARKSQVNKSNVRYSKSSGCISDEREKQPNARPHRCRFVCSIVTKNENQIERQATDRPTNQRGERKLYISITSNVHGFSIFLRQETHCVCMCASASRCRRMHESWVSNFCVRWLRVSGVFFYPSPVVFLLRMTVILNRINKNLSQTNHNNNQFFTLFPFFLFVHINRKEILRRGKQPN